MTIGVFSTLSAVTFFRTSWTKVGSKEKRMNRIESNRRHPLLFFGRCFSLFLLMGEMIDVALSLPNLVFKRGRGMPASASAIARSDVLNHQFDDYRSLHRPGTILLILFRCHPSIRFWHHPARHQIWHQRGSQYLIFTPTFCPLPTWYGTVLEINLKASKKSIVVKLMMMVVDEMMYINSINE